MRFLGPVGQDFSRWEWVRQAPKTRTRRVKACFFRPTPSPFVSEPPSISRPSAEPEDHFSLVYDELRKLAQHLVHRFRPGQTLQPTALVHEAYLKLAKHDPAKWNGRGHFYGVAARAMRSILVDYVRAKRAAKRNPQGGGRIVELDELVASYEDRAIDLLGLDEALNQLADFDQRLADCVELRFFAGLSAAEISEVHDVSKRTVERDLLAARHWLARAMQ